MSMHSFNSNTTRLNCGQNNHDKIQRDMRHTDLSQLAHQLSDKTRKND